MPVERSSALMDAESFLLGAAIQMFFLSSEALTTASLSKS